MWGWYAMSVFIVASIYQSVVNIKDREPPKGMWIFLAVFNTLGLIACIGIIIRGYPAMF
jgi:hypothetical protein